MYSVTLRNSNNFATVQSFQYMKACRIHYILMKYKLMLLFQNLSWVDQILVRRALNLAKKALDVAVLPNEM